jgi:hypothetical protein
MADDAPTPEQMVPSLLHAVTWAFMFGFADALLLRKPWPVWTSAVGVSLGSHIVGTHWQTIKPWVGQGVASAI